MTHDYIKLSLYEKYRRSLNEKKNKSLKTEPIFHSDSQQQLKSNKVVFPLKRPALNTVIKSKSLIKSRILSTPTHLMHLHPFLYSRLGLSFRLNLRFCRFRKKIVSLVNLCLIVERLILFNFENRLMEILLILFGRGNQLL